MGANANVARAAARGDGGFVEGGAPSGNVDPNSAGANIGAAGKLEASRKQEKDEIVEAHVALTDFYLGKLAEWRCRVVLLLQCL